MDFQKKDWQFRDLITEDELNRMEDGIEEGITKAEQAQQTATDAQTNLDNHVSATTGVHGATSTATPNTLVQRDPAGRFKAAAPVEADDVARKAEVDAHIAALVSDPGGVHGLQVETGTWTPYVAGTTTPGSHTYAQQNGYYIRIGKLIKIDATVIASSKDVDWAGAVYIGGLPYPVKLDPWKYISFSVSRFDNVNFGSSAEQITASIDAGTEGETNRIKFYKINSGGEVSNLDAADITGTTFHIHVSGVYDIS